MLTRATLKQKKCKECGTKFQPRGSFDPVCSSIECKVAYGLKVAAKSKAKREKAERIQQQVDRKIIRMKKDDLKTRREWLVDAQRAFNAFIRLRDQMKGYPCISSGRPLDWSGNAVDAGHYHSVGSAPHLRFNEDNCHAQSKKDNRYGAGCAVDYRLGLIARIGIKRVEALESDQRPRKWSIEELKQITATYKQKLRDLKKGIE